MQNVREDHLWKCPALFNRRKTVRLHDSTFSHSAKIRQETLWFYDTSTIVSYLMPNPIFTNVLNI